MRLVMLGYTSNYYRALRWCGLMLCCLLFAQDVFASQDNYVLGVFPYFSPTRLEGLYSPMAAELNAHTDKPVRFRTTSDFQSFLENLRAGEYDLALVQPFFYVAAVDEMGYMPLVRADRPFRSVVVVMADSEIRQASDLRGKLIATPPPHVPAVHLARQALRQQGLSLQEDVQFRALPNADSCLQQLMIGHADACVTGPLGASSFAQRHGVNFHTVIETIALPNLAFIVHSRVDEAQRARWQTYLSELSSNESGQVILESINVRAFVPAKDRDYDPVRRFIEQMDGPWLPSVR